MTFCLFVFEHLTNVHDKSELNSVIELQVSILSTSILHPLIYQNYGCMAMAFSDVTTREIDDTSSLHLIGCIMNTFDPKCNPLEVEDTIFLPRAGKM